MGDNSDKILEKIDSEIKKLTRLKKEIAEVEAGILLLEKQLKVSLYELAMSRRFML